MVAAGYFPGPDGVRACQRIGARSAGNAQGCIEIRIEDPHQGERVITGFQVDGQCRCGIGKGQAVGSRPVSQKKLIAETSNLQASRDGRVRVLIFQHKGII